MLQPSPTRSFSLSEWLSVATKLLVFPAAGTSQEDHSRGSLGFLVAQRPPLPESCSCEFGAGKGIVRI